MRAPILPLGVVFPQIAPVTVLHVYHLQEIRQIHHLCTFTTLLWALSPSRFLLLLRLTLIAEGRVLIIFLIASSTPSYTAHAPPIV